MTDTAVEFLLQNVQQLLLYQGELISNARGDIEKLEQDLRALNTFLQDTITKRRENERLNELVREIRDVVHEAEDIIDSYVTLAAEPKSTHFFLRAFRKPVDLLEIAKAVQTISSKIEDICGNLNTIRLNSISFAEDSSHEEIEAPIIRRENLIGLEEESEEIIGYLKEETDKLDPIAIVGMPGLGKTTLAGKIFHDPEVQRLFPTRIWVYISQNLTLKKVFLAILGALTKLTDDTRDKSDEELAYMVCDHLQNGSFLIVLDDVWTRDDWDNLKTAFPTTNVRMGKILITSSFEEVGCYANFDRIPVHVSLLTPDEGWLLLQYEAFGKPESPPELESPGRLIVDHCGELPIAIVTIGRILARKGNFWDVTARRNTWIQVSESVSRHLNSGGHAVEHIERVYDKLPCHLRACFLYLGIFPEDFEISASKLICMWIAEGFVLQKDDRSLEETAQSYLDYFVNMGLLTVSKMKPNGKVKTCRFHDILRDFCRHEASGEIENFLQEVKMTSEGRFFPASVHKYRRLCIRPNVVNDFFSIKPLGPSVRSFVCLSEDDVDLPDESISDNISEAFKLLRVLEIKPVKFSKLPSDVFHLVHLRYIVLSFDQSTLPRAFSKLWNIQTLIVHTTSPTLEVKADIWRLMHLTHFKTNASATLPQPGRHSKEGDKIQTLGTISPESCNEKVLGQIRNVKKLGIRGQLALVFDPENGSFDSLGKLGRLEKLMLMNDQGKLDCLPSPYQFPPKLRRLTLSNTHLDWTHMSILGLLENLEVLKLKDKAFTGDTWEVVDGGFRSLEFLCIENTDLTCWTASGHHFPRLRSLELRNCEELQEIPFGFANIPSFKALNLHCSKNAALSAARILKEKQKEQDEKTAKINGFQLCITA